MSVRESCHLKERNAYQEIERICAIELKPQTNSSLSPRVSLAFFLFLLPSHLAGHWSSLRLSGPLDLSYLLDFLYEAKRTKRFQRERLGLERDILEFNSKLLICRILVYTTDFPP